MTVGYDLSVMTNRENKINGRKALNGDSRKKHLRGSKRRANKAARRAGKVTV